MILGICVAAPYVPATPTLGRDNVVVPPKATNPPPARPVPAVTVKEGFNNFEFVTTALLIVVVPSFAIVISP